LVICDDERECVQLRDYLTLGGDELLKRELEKYLKWKAALPRFVANIATAVCTYLKRTLPCSSTKKKKKTKASDRTTAKATGSTDSRGGSWGRTQSRGGSSRGGASANKRSRRGAKIASMSRSEDTGKIIADSDALADLYVSTLLFYF